MRKILGLLLPLALLAVALMSCGDADDERLTGKWQLQRLDYPDGTSEAAGDVFYNFQKGSFSAICAMENYEYSTFFGNYALQGGKISIILLYDYDGAVYDRYIGWSSKEKTFVVEELNSHSMRLNSGDTIAIFRRY
jgi:hypothetical protein